MLQYSDFSKAISIKSISKIRSEFENSEQSKEKVSKKMSTKFIIVTLFVASTCFLSCGKEKEEKVLPDPEGTVECIIDAEGYNLIIHDLKDNKGNSYDLHSFFSWSFPDNIRMTNSGYYPNPDIDISDIDFSGFGNMSSFISNVGKVKGLGNIVKIPPLESFGNKLSSEAENGYVINFLQFQTIYARMYVVGPIVNNSGNVIGVKVKYHYPFE